MSGFFKKYSVFVVFVGLLSSAFAGEAQDVLSTSGVRGGVIVYADCPDATLLNVLGTNQFFYVHGLTRSAADAFTYRTILRTNGRDGSVMVDEWDGANLPFVQRYVNLLLLGDGAAPSAAEIDRVLAPLGVVMQKQGGVWVVIQTKAWPSTIDEWASYKHGANNYFTSYDLEVGPPAGLQWMVEPRYTTWHFGVSAINFIISAGGRTFYIEDEKPTAIAGGRLPDRWALIARDAFNGKMLWKKMMSNWGPASWGKAERLYTGGFIIPGTAESAQARFAAAGDRLYGVTDHNGPIVSMDAATGEILRTYAGTESCNQVLFHNGKLYLFGINGKSVLIVDPDTGIELNSFNPGQKAVSIVGNKMVLLGSGWMRAYDATTFTQLWANTTTAPSDADIRLTDHVVVGSNGDLWKVYSAATGAYLWSYQTPDQPDFIAADKTVNLDQAFVVNSNVYFFKGNNGFDMIQRDETSGSVEQDLQTTDIFYSSHHHRCFDDIVTPNWIIAGQNGIEFVNLTGGGNQVCNWTRSACSSGLTPANGLLYVPPHSCACSGESMLRGTMVYAPQKSAAGRSFSSNSERLLTGSAFGSVSGRAMAASDWATYRYTSERRSATETFVPETLSEMWSFDFGRAVTAPTIAEGRVYVADKETHTLFALSAASGVQLWSFAAGGTLDGPPTIYGDCVIFGCSDGRVYCLRASDGALVWRFQAAPYDCRNMQWEQVGSVWPVHGSVLVKNGQVYCAAGVSARLDGGIWVYKLDALTGAVLNSRHVESLSPDPLPATNQTGNRDGLRSDVFVADGIGNLFISNYGFSSSLVPTVYDVVSGVTGYSETSGISAMAHLHATATLTDDTWNHRVVWTYGGVHGQILTIDDQNVYGVRALNESDFGTRYIPGKGYLLFSQPKTKPGNTTDTSAFPDAFDTDFFARPSTQMTWWKQIPIRARSLLKAGNHLYLAGVPDEIPLDDPYAAFDGRLGFELWTVNPVNGERQGILNLDGVPMFDGMAAAEGSLFVTTEDGKLYCLSQPESAPNAIAAISPAFGTVSTSFTFDATGSSDLDGWINSYEWRIDGSLVSTNATFSRTFPSNGARVVELVVRDNDGMEAAATTAFSVRDDLSDSDNDGLFDAWELEFYGNLAQDAASDTEPDGLSALVEMALGSNPTLVDTDADQIPDNIEVLIGSSLIDPEDFLDLQLTPTSVKNQLQLRWTSSEGRLYNVWSSQDITHGLTNLVAQNVTATPPMNSLLVSLDGVTNAFYRVQLVNNPPASQNQAPIAVDDIAYVPFGQASLIDVLANDYDPDMGSITLDSVSQGLHGTSSIFSGDVRYVPETGWIGSDELTYFVRDAEGAISSATVTVYTENAGNMVVDSKMDQLPTLVSAGSSTAAGSGWLLISTNQRKWDWDRSNHYYFPYAPGQAALQIIHDSSTAIGAQPIRFRAFLAGNAVVKVSVYGASSGTDSFTSATGPGTLLYTSGNLTGNAGWTNIVGSVDFGMSGYDYIIIRLWPVTVDLNQGQFIALDDFYIGNGAGEPATEPPVAPSSLTAVATVPGSIQLTWADLSDNESGFGIERKTGTEAFAVVGSAAVNATSATDSGLLPETTYTYRVYAFNVQGNSGYTAEVSATTLAGAGPVETNLLYECETLSKTSTDTVSTYNDASASGGQWDFLAANAVGDYVEYTVNVPVAGTFTVQYAYKGKASRGVCQLKIDGVNQGAAVNQSSVTGWTSADLGSKTLTAGNHLFRFQISAIGASGYDLSADCIRLNGN